MSLVVSRRNQDEFTMNLPMSGGNLYQYVTVLGVALAAVAVYGISQAADAHDAKHRAFLEKWIAENDEAKQVWGDYMKQQKANVDVIIWFLVGVFVFGILLATAGGILWYVKKQRFDDLRIASEITRLQIELAEMQKQKKLILGST